ncbi:hypothetical protein RHMOL_Rhmol04G0264300 [Rhododendron molle]|uniref:Uncharacterized protein n=1 Tax=Rhododendron molle TaxID=49168 RepID=A0ACC0P5P5_RHOML|nr:hypothetical protein RHMOL_Rhmol04G0264300 [Rhododendron molle]
MAMQVWVEYDGGKKEMNVTMAPVHVPKPSTPLLTLSKDLSPILNQTIFVLEFGVLSGVVYYVRRKRKFAEVLEDWELDYGPHRFKYKDLYIATKGFGENELLGSGGFGEILRTVDPKLGDQYVEEEVELVLKLGLWCLHFEPVARPSMRQVMQYLERDIPLPKLKLMGNSATGLMFAHREEFDDFAMSNPQLSSVAESFLSGGR